VKATNGDTFLGAEDFDNELVHFLLAEFKRSSGIDLSQDRLALQRFREAEKAKVELSSTLNTNNNIPFLTANASGPVHFDYKLTRTNFENLTKRTRSPQRRRQKKKDVIEVKNHADAILYDTEKSIKEFKDQLNPQQLADLERELGALKNLMCECRS